MTIIIVMGRHSDHSPCSFISGRLLMSHGLRKVQLLAWDLLSIRVCLRIRCWVLPKVLQAEGCYAGPLNWEHVFFPFIKHWFSRQFMRDDFWEYFGLIQWSCKSRLPLFSEHVYRLKPPVPRVRWQHLHQSLPLLKDHLRTGWTRFFVCKSSG